LKLTYAEISSVGPVRPHNEDYLRFWEAEDEREIRARGAVALVADGVGGHGAGEVASELAVERALGTFHEANPTATDNQLLWRMFNAANLAVYDEGMKRGGPERMATTLTISLFRRNEVAVGHVGDSRAYLVRQGQVKQLTADHTYVAMQLKMKFISRHEAMTSEMRGMLTRSIGTNPTVQVDYARSVLHARDVIVQCSDGLHGCVTDNELRDFVMRLPPDEACVELARLAEKRGSEDNISVQVIRVESVPRVGYYRGSVAYFAPAPAPATAEMEAGQVLDERFQIDGLIHRSGMSSVLKATDLKTGRAVALKVPLPTLEADPAFFSRFEREAEIGRKLDHPGVLKFIDVEGTTQSRPYLVMEYLEGQTLATMIQRAGMVPVDEALRIVSRVCDGLAYLHEHGIVHRDLKPQNIMLCNDGTQRIMDFGIAKTEAARRITFGGFSPTLGTPDYMAPEQVKGQRGDERTDVYSLGAILYEMVTGRVPFEGPNAYAIMNARLIGDPVAPRERNPQVPPQVEEIVLHAMARDPGGRYPTALAMKAEVDAPSSVTLEGRASRLEAPRESINRWRRVRLVAIATAAPIILFLLLWLLLAHQAHH
jgi:serine/threonine-protein kinase